MIELFQGRNRPRKYSFELSTESDIRRVVELLSEVTLPFVNLRGEFDSFKRSRSDLPVANCSRVWCRRIRRQTGNLLTNKIHRPGPPSWALVAGLDRRRQQDRLQHRPWSLGQSLHPMRRQVTAAGYVGCCVGSGCWKHRLEDGAAPQHVGACDRLEEHLQRGGRPPGVDSSMRAASASASASRDCRRADPPRFERRIPVGLGVDRAGSAVACSVRQRSEADSPNCRSCGRAVGVTCGVRCRDRPN